MQVLPVLKVGEQDCNAVPNMQGSACILMHAWTALQRLPFTCGWGCADYTLLLVLPPHMQTARYTPTTAPAHSRCSRQ
jgi:hypothetical protein